MCVTQSVRVCVCSSPRGRRAPPASEGAAAGGPQLPAPSTPTPAPWGAAPTGTPPPRPPAAGTHRRTRSLLGLHSATSSPGLYWYQFTRSPLVPVHQVSTGSTQRYQFTRPLLVLNRATSSSRSLLVLQSGTSSPGLYWFYKALPVHLASTGYTQRYQLNSTGSTQRYLVALLILLTFCLLSSLSADTLIGSPSQ